MAMKTIYNRKTGEAIEKESVDAREILVSNPDLYTTINPNKDAKDLSDSPQNVANVENEFRREPVGDDPPEKEREQPIIRNPVTDRPKLGVSERDSETHKEAAAKAAEQRRDQQTQRGAQVNPRGLQPPEAGASAPAPKK